MSRRRCFYENSGTKVWHSFQTFLNLRLCNGTPVFGHWQEKDTQVQQEHVNTLENEKYERLPETEQMNEKADVNVKQWASSVTCFGKILH